jgi:DNA-binding response OmpR family regulator
VLVSAQGQHGAIESGLACGADRYVVKPFSPGQLFATVADLLER